MEGKMICPKCLSKNIEILANHDCWVDSEGKVKRYIHEPKFHDDDTARCVDCGESSVVWFFKPRG